MLCWTLVHFSDPTLLKNNTHLWFFPKEPELVLGFAHCVFGVGFDALVLGRADGAVRPGALDVLAEVLEWEVARGIEARFEGLHHNSGILEQQNPARPTNTTERVVITVDQTFIFALISLAKTN